VAGPDGSRGVVGKGRRLLLTAVAIALLDGRAALTGAAPPGAAEGGHPSATTKSGALSADERKKLLAQRDQLNREAAAFQAQHKLAEAIGSAKSLLAIERRVYGDISDEVAGSLSGIGGAEVAQGDLAAARKAMSEALSILETLHPGNSSPSMKGVQWELHDVGIRERLSPGQRQELAQADQALFQSKELGSRGQFRKAIPFAERATDIHRRILGPDSPYYAKCLNELALFYESAGNYAKAVSQHRQVLEIYKKNLGENSANTAVSLNNLGLVYEEIGDYAKAEPLFRQALEIKKKVCGENDPSTATSLKSLALLYQTTGRYSKAEPLYRQALTIRRKTLGENHPQTATALNSLGLLYYEMADYSKAEPLYQQALQISKKAFGENHPRTATSLNNLALLYDAMARYSKAEPLYRQALEIHRKVLGENHPDTATTLNNLAGLYRDMLDYAKAEPLYRQALEIDKKALGKNHPKTGADVGNLAQLYLSMGKYAQAEPLCRQALEISQKALGENHPYTATSLVNLADLYWQMADYAKAEPLYRRALEIDRKVLGEQHPGTATDLNKLALLLQAMGNYTEALTRSRQALEIYKSAVGENHPGYAACVNRLASIYELMGDVAKAEPLFRQALTTDEKLFGKNHPRTGSDVNNLAGLYLSTGKYAQAEPLCRRAVEISQKALGEDHPDTAIAINNLARLHQLMGDYAQAEPLYRRALESEMKVLGKNHPATATSLSNLAALYHLMGESGRAEPPCRTALESFQRLLVDSFGILSEREQLIFEAKSRANLDAYLSMTGTPNYRASTAKPVSDADVYRYVLLGKGIVTAQQAFIHLKLRHADLDPLFQELAQDGRRLQKLRFAPPSDPQQQAAWRSEIGRLEEERNVDQQKLSAQSGEFRRLEESLQADHDHVKQLQASLPPKSALVDVLEYTHYSPPPDKKGSYISEQRLVAFVVKPDGPVVRVELGPVKPLATAAERWRRAIVSRRGTAEAVAAAEGSGSGVAPELFLRERLYDPLRPFLENVDLLLVSPDGFLNQIPLAALPGSKAGTYLIEEVALSVVPIPRELTDLLSAKPRESSGDSSLMLVGGVDFGGDPGLASPAQKDIAMVLPPRRAAVRGSAGYVFPSLPGTVKEIEGIANIFRERFGTHNLQVLTTSHATEDAIREEAPRHRWLHLATHGFFSPEGIPSTLDPRKADRERPLGEALSDQNRIGGFDPGLLSGIALAGANRDSKQTLASSTDLSKDADDGILTALEVGALDLRNVDLAVLSACETGLGRAAGGEGVLGLQRALQTAGARTCVTSLWKVDDAATQTLMLEFYGNLWGIDPATGKPRNKLGKLEALRQAQLTILRHYDPVRGKLRGLDLLDEPANAPQHGSPFYWAAFVLSGDWR